MAQNGAKIKGVLCHFVNWFPADFLEQIQLCKFKIVTTWIIIVQVDHISVKARGEFAE